MLLSLSSIHTKVIADCTCCKKFKFSIELFDAITGECILNQEFTHKSFRCKTVNSIYFKKIRSRGIIKVGFTIENIQSLPEEIGAPIINSRYWSSEPYWSTEPFSDYALCIF